MLDVALAISLLLATDDKALAKEALTPLNDLIGAWKGSGQPNVNSPVEKRKGSWSETITWTWQLKGEPKIIVEFKDGKHFKAGALRYRPAQKDYEFALTTAADEKRLFHGPLEGQQLTLTGGDDARGEDQRLVFQWLHGSRLIYRWETKTKEQRSFTKVFQVGATKEGSDFAKAGSGAPECIVTGGLATIPVTYKGKTYYVCCTGCQAAFEDNPEQVLKEYAERKAKEKKK
jgi:YHS domain-containing protein